MLRNKAILVLMLAFVVLACFNGFSQNTTKYWFFGYKAGLNFNTSNPTTVIGGKTNSFEGCATVSNATGQLLFYTQGDTIWDRNHNVMPNGTGIMGHTSSAQSSLIIKKPGSSNIYYLFTSSDMGTNGANGYRYSEIDMSLNGGFGDVTANKNILLYAPCSERLSAVCHCNGKDFWVVTQPSNQTGIKSFLVSSAGVNTSPVTSGTTFVPLNSNSSKRYIGQIKFTPDATKMGILEYNGSLRIYNFDNLSGTVTSSLVLAGTIGVGYTLEFSPDSKKVFWCTSGWIRQTDLCPPFTTVALHNFNYKNPNPSFASMQLATDGNIYITHFANFSVARDSLSVLLNPNSAAPPLAYKSIYLGGNLTGWGLPNFCINDIIPYVPPTNTVSSFSSLPISCNTYSFNPSSITSSNSCGQTYSVAINSAIWDFGDPSSGPANSSTLLNPTHSYSSNGSYTVTQIVFYKCTSDTLKQVVNVASNLSINSTTLSATCSSPTGSVVINNVINGVPNYTIAEGSNTLAAGVTIPYTITPVSVGTHTYIVTSSNGCITTFTANISPGFSSPNISSVSPVTLTCNNPTVNLNASTTSTGVLTYTWSGPGILSGANTLTATVNQPGIYTVIIAQGSCTNSAIVNVTSNTNTPNISISSPSTINCLNTNIVLTGTSSTSGVTYSWSPQNVSTNSTIATVAGNYTFIVTNTITGCTSQSVVTITQNTTAPNVSAATANTLTCLTTSITLIGNSTTGGVTYSWSPQNVLTNTAVATVTGNYTLTVTNPVNGCTSLTVVSVNQNTVLPNISVAIPSTLTCLTTSVTLTGNSTSTGATYSWAPQNVNTNTTLATSVGNYTFTVTDLSNGCTAHTVVAVNQNTTSPNVSASIPNTLTCLTTSVILTGNSTNTGSSYTWQPQNANTNTVVANSAGNYTLTVSDPLNGCTNSTIITVVQNGAFPNISITQPPTLTCLTTSITLSGNSTTSGVTFSWSPQNVSTNTTVVTSAGNYSFFVIDPNNGCTSTSVVAVNQNIAPPFFTATSSNSLNCIVNSSTLSANGTGLLFVWNGGSLSNAVNPAVVSAGGNYSVTATDLFNGCSTTSVVTITQNSMVPNISVLSSGNLNCNTSSVTLTGSSTTGGVTYQWSSGPSSYSYAVSLPSTYTLTITDPSNGCSSFTAISVSSTPMFTFNITVLNQINCFGTNTGALQVNNLGGGLAPFIVTNINNSNTISNITSFPVNLNGLSAGNYSIQVTDANGCRQTLFASIHQPPALIVGVSGNTVICEGDSSNITSNVNGGTSPYNYLWSPIGGNGSAMNITPTISTNFTLTVTDNNGCKALASVAIMVNPKPNASLVNGKLVGCSPVCASFSLTQSQNTGYTYMWSFGSSIPTSTIISSNIFNPEICFTAPGTYSASIFIKSPEGCSANVNYTNLITVYPKPIADFSFTPEKPDILDNPDVNFINQSNGANSYYWYNVNAMFSQESNPMCIFTEPGKFLITLISSNGQCSDTLSKYITVEDDFFLYIPNSFTPNEDGLNDYFYPVLTGDFSSRNYSFEIFDRWGDLLYRSNNQNETKWNGFYKNELCKDDIYIWKLSFTNSKGKAYEKTGHVTLIK